MANDDSHAHCALVRPISGTFFRLAALTRDASLVRSCVRLTSVGFWQFDLGDDVAHQQMQLLAVEYLAAAAILGDSLWGMMVMELPPHITFPQRVSMLFSKTILRLVRLDAQRAMDVYHLWWRYLPVPDPSVPQGPMLVEEGLTDLATPMLPDIDFTGPFLGTILRLLAKQGSWYIDLEPAAIIARALRSVSVSKAPLQTSRLPTRRCNLQERVRSGPRILQRSCTSHTPFHASPPQAVPRRCGDRKAFPALAREVICTLGPGVSSPASKLLFTRHVKLLYKALYLRKDVAGA
jgi:hypothetical protein